MNETRSDNPLVSIIVRTKDRLKLLTRALKSIADQTYRPIEVVLVNDGGCGLDVDGLREMLGDVALNYVRLEESKGRSRAGNAGIENAQGTYVGFLDDDDRFLANHVATLAGFLISSGESAAYTDAAVVRSIPSRDGYADISREVLHSVSFDRDQLLFQNYIPLLCLMVSRTLLAREHFDPEFDLFEDWEMLIRLAQNASFHHIPDITAEYHMRDDNTTQYLHPDTYPHIEARYKVYRKHNHLLRERAISIFERLLAERDRFKEMQKQAQARAAEAQNYIAEKESELALVRDYVRTKEDELEARRIYIEEKEAELSKMRKLLGSNHRLPGTSPHSEVEHKALSASSEGVQGVVSIVILTYNGEKFIRDLLDLIKSQKIKKACEIIMIDSSSDDRTFAIASEYDIKQFKIDRTTFSHPKTRNMGVSLCRGEYIVFITQDAIPANNLWLSELIKPLEDCRQIAASYSRQLPMPGCNPLEAKDIYLGAPCVDEIRSANMHVDWQKQDYLSNIHRYIRFSNVSACYRGDLLRENLFDERLPMVEDQEWCKRIIEKGYPVYYASKSMVLHSHEFGAKERYRRFYDYGASFRMFMPNNPPRRISCVKSAVFESVNDFFFILSDRRSKKSKLKWVCLSPILRIAANYGLYRGWTSG